MTSQNPFLLAAETPHPSPHLLPLLHSNPSLASRQDDHGYSLLHAAASYNHLSLLSTLIHDFHVPANLTDEDGETCLFVCETLACARLLVDELGVAIGARNDEGKTARAKIEEEGEFAEVAVFLRIRELEAGGGGSGDGVSTGAPVAAAVSRGFGGGDRPPRVPDGISVSIGTVSTDELGDDVVDADFRRRIEELAARDDFQGAEGQRALRELVTEAVRGQMREERVVRQRTT